jgi:tRNA threonylcarbamoyladenosine biosynthesis protein TsaB
MKNIQLFIDTSNNQQAIIALEIDGEKFEKHIDTPQHSSQVVIPTIDELLKEHSLTPENITDIKVNPGPGSFTGLRVGASIANTFSWVLDIPVNGKKDIPAEPVYE